ncbi:hypothetical protein GJ744_012001 [Endocarpon pusillum]|uniref:Uncharacterized protein n=1 Tax=Endocarpon pusillum TaxID=364733 RepID=A0A8H7APK6_9EURO|nr:hypothetical protein GJ744_012001 [Endocarpon pusillum]
MSSDSTNLEPLPRRARKPSHLHHQRLIRTARLTFWESITKSTSSESQWCDKAIAFLQEGCQGRNKNDEKLAEVLKRHLRAGDDLDAPPNDDCENWHKAQRDFVKDYGTHQQVFEKLTEKVKEDCERILKDTNILHQPVSSRTKDLFSLKDKVREQKKGPATRPIYEESTAELHQRIGDLAAIRILVYFPDNIPRAVEAIKSSGAFEIPEAVVSFSRTRFYQSARDIVQHRRAYLSTTWMGPGRNA